MSSQCLAQQAVMRCWRKGAAGVVQKVQGVRLARMEVVLQGFCMLHTSHGHKWGQRGPDITYFRYIHCV